MSESAFKNFINPSVVKKIGLTFKEAYPEFDLPKFLSLSRKLEALELKQRVLLITSELRKLLPADYQVDHQILRTVLNLKRLQGFELWPVSEYISQFGLEHVKESLELMHTLTQQFTSEFAVRSFLLKHPELVLAQLETWIKDENVHVRRWVSEGTRPILPWGGKIPSFIKEPATLHLLEKLKYDEELYVRKSVANHLNDITKNHPELVVETLGRWVKESPEEHLEKIHWIKKQALRTLIKKGHRGALELMGVTKKTEVKLSSLALKKKRLSVGESLEFNFSIASTSAKTQTLIVDYLIAFRKANGSLAAKVFKLKQVHLGAGEKVSLTKKHSLKKITTMTFYPGKHELQIQVNGVIMERLAFNLCV